MRSIRHFQLSKITLGYLESQFFIYTDDATHLSSIVIREMHSRQPEILWQRAARRVQAKGESINARGL